MASMQCQEPVQQTTVVCQKTTTETCYSKADHGQSFTDKVKEMAHSATKMFDHKNHHQDNGQHCNQTHAGYGVAKTHASTDYAQQSSASHCPGTTEKKEGHGGNFIANIGEHIKNMTSRKKKNRAGNCNDSGSDTSSSDESDNESCKEKNCRSSC